MVNYFSKKIIDFFGYLINKTEIKDKTNGTNFSHPKYGGHRAYTVSEKTCSGLYASSQQLKGRT